MLYVRTKVLPSAIHGLGLFADEFIPKGTVVWRFTEGFDQKFSREQLLAFPEAIQIFLYKYAWKGRQSGLYCLAADNGRYFNHCEDPNVRSAYVPGEIEVVTTAVKDIQPGEEITDDYSSFEDPDDPENALEEIARNYGLVDELDPRLKQRFGLSRA